MTAVNTLDMHANNSNKIESTASRHVLFHWIGTLVWCGFIFAIWYFFREELVAATLENKVFYFIYLFPVFGVMLLYKAISETVGWRKFGNTSVVLNPFPGQLGGVVSGRITLAVKYDSSHEPEVTLTCIRHHLEKRANKTRMVATPVWQDRITTRTERSSGGSAIAFSFNPAADLPSSQKAGRGMIRISQILLTVF